jgi:type IV pilus assembly protein PilC
MEFRCRIGTTGGDVTSGVYVAENETSLRREFEERGLYVLSLKRRGGLAWLTATRGRRRPSEQEFIAFNQELATLLKAGMPLVQSLEILRQGVANPIFKGVLDGVCDRVKAGTALSEAFAEHGDLFSPVYPAVLMAGERSGDLDGVIRRYVAYTKVLSTVRRKTISALIYPTILVALMFLLLGIVVLQVVPAFSDFYGSFDKPLPVSTQLIVAVSNVLVSYFWLILGLGVFVVAGGVAWFRQLERRVQVDHLLLRLPWVGSIARRFATAQLARTLATLLAGGVPLVHGLDIAGRSMTNRYLAKELEVVARQVREGQSFASALLARALFPDVATKMVEVGESTGALREMLNSLADFYDEEIETEMGRFVTVIEPALLVIMGVIVAAIVLALYMPLFQLSSVVGG